MMEPRDDSESLESLALPSDGGAISIIPESQPEAPIERPLKKRKTRSSAKKQRLAETACVAICHLENMPLEILAEILSHSSSPRDVLSLARCSKFFCNTLVNNQATDFIWRHARSQCQPAPVPDPTPNFTEASYAALLFDGGECENCGKKTQEMYHSYTLRVRLCDKGACINAWRMSHLLAVDGTSPTRYKDIAAWIPRAEPKSITTYHGNRIYVRISDWTAAVDAYNMVQLSPTDREAYVREKHALAARLPQIMEHAKKLIEWRAKRKTAARSIKSRNDAYARNFAALEGWKAYDLLRTKTFSGLHRAKTAALEIVTASDFALIRSTVEAEIVELKERRERREAESAYRNRRVEVEKHYNRLKSAADKQVLPTLPEFRKLSIMKVMQDSKSDATKELKNSKLVAELLQDNLEKWTQDARTDLAAVLGFPGWKIASKKWLHPVDRLTALFKCEKCDNVPRKQGEERSLSFAKVCEHRCPHLDKKHRSRDNWSAQMFEPDTKAIDAVNQILTLCETSAEDPTSIETVRALGSRIVCLSCSSQIRMSFQTVIRHCKRHEDPKFAVTPENDVGLLSYAKYPIELGITAQLLAKSDDVEKQRAQKIYGCRHCRAVRVSGFTPAAGSEQVEHVSNDKQIAAAKDVPLQTKMFSFNGLRSHVKEKHGIAEIGDEDFYRQKV